MIHDVFAPIPERQMAETCSEIFAGGYEYFQNGEDIERYGAGEAFLTNPNIEIISMQINYLEGLPGQRRAPIKFATLGVKLPDTAQILEEYEGSIGRYHRLGSGPTIRSILSSVPRFRVRGWPAINEWFSETVERDNKTLSVAHVLCRTEDNVLTSALIYPQKIREEIGLAARDAFVTSLPELSDDTRDAMKRHVIHTPRIAVTLGALVASNQLLSTDTFRETVDQFLGPART